MGGGGGGGELCENTEIVLEIHIKETGVLIMQLLRLSRLDKVICYSTFSDDQFICLICISIFVISEVFEDSSLTEVVHTNIPISS